MYGCANRNGTSFLCFCYPAQHIHSHAHSHTKLNTPSPHPFTTPMLTVSSQPSQTGFSNSLLPTYQSKPTDTPPLSVVTILPAANENDFAVLHSGLTPKPIDVPATENSRPAGGNIQSDVVEEGSLVGQKRRRHRIEDC